MLRTNARALDDDDMILQEVTRIFFVLKFGFKLLVN